MAADPDAFATEVARLCGPEEAEALRRYLTDLAELYRLQLPTFIDRNLDSPLDLLRPELLRLARRGGFRRLSRHVDDAFSDERLRRLFSFQALYAGVSPFRAIAAYAVIAQLDIGAGVVHPVGGIGAVPRALAASAVDAGVVVRYGTTVRDLDVRGSRVTGVLLENGERLPADAVVVTADAPHRLVPGCAGRAGRSTRRPAWRCTSACAPSCPGSRTTRSASAVRGGRCSTSYPRRRDHDRPEPAGQHAVGHRPVAWLPRAARCSASSPPTPNLDRRSGGNPDLDWARIAPRYRDELLATLEARGWTGLTGAVEVEELATPAGWAAQGMAAGTPFALAHTFGQTGPFRPSTLPRRGPENVVLAGSSVQPGVGVPMVLLSGRLAAERITGPVPR